jgi:hypothetical protein
MSKHILNTKKKKVKRLSASQTYYQTAFITNPCEQLFGPKPLDYSIASNDSIQLDKSANALSNESTGESILTTSFSYTKSSVEPTKATNDENNKSINNNRFDYIPAPKWTKHQNTILEEYFKRNRYPKKSDIKSYSLKLNVMDNDIEVNYSN